MRFAHISDLHLGKKLSNYDMKDDQGHILDQIADLVVSEGVDALLIAGDVYDKHMPSEDAVGLFSGFLTRMSREGIPVYVSAGNHDSGRRLDYCSGILGDNHIHISGEFKGSAEKFIMSKDGLTVNIYLLPFVRPYTVGIVCDTEVHGLDQAILKVLENSDIDPGEVNVLVAHQFVRDVSGSELIEGSEDLRPRVGGTDMLASDILNGFDYVALGHLHVPQDVGTPCIRYCGSPLKYSESEAHVSKSLTIVDVLGKDDVRVSTIPLKPLRDLRVVKGSMEDVLASGPSDDFVYVTLDSVTDNVEARLRKAFPRLCDVRFAGMVERKVSRQMSVDDAREGRMDDLFKMFFKEITGNELTQSQLTILDDVVSDLGGDAE